MPAQCVESDVEIAAPREAVYAYLADFPRHMEWNEQPQRMTPLNEGPARVGSRYSTLESMPSNMPLKQRLMFKVAMPIMKMVHGMSDETIAEITELDEGKRVAWAAHLPSKRSGDMMRMRWALDLEDAGDGTRVCQQCEVDPPEGSPFAKMINEEFAAEIRHGIDGNLAKLKTILENAVAFA